MTAATGQVAEQAERAGSPRQTPKATRRGPSRGDARLALWLILPTVALLAAVIGYPVIYAVVQSLKLDKARRPAWTATGFFQSGGKYVGEQVLLVLVQLRQASAPNGTTGHEFLAGREHQR